MLLSIYTYSPFAEYDGIHEATKKKIFKRKSLNSESNPSEYCIGIKYFVLYDESKVIDTQAHHYEAMDRYSLAKITHLCKSTLIYLYMAE